jgi:hypothetical protein
MIAPPAKQSRLKGYLLLCLATSWEDSRPGKDVGRAHGVRSQRPCTPLLTASQIRTSPSSGAHSPCGYAVRTTVQTRWMASLPNGGRTFACPRCECMDAWLDGTSSTERTQIPKVPSEIWSTRRDGLYEREADALQDHKDGSVLKPVCGPIMPQPRKASSSACSHRIS